MGLATNHIYKTKEGEKKETAQFHNCVAFGKTADVIAQWVKKGQEIMVEGRIEYRSWDKKEGGKGYITEIMIETFQFGQKAKGTDGGGRESVRENKEESGHVVPVIDLNEENPPVEGEENLPF